MKGFYIVVLVEEGYNKGAIYIGNIVTFEVIDALAAIINFIESYRTTTLLGITRTSNEGFNDIITIIFGTPFNTNLITIYLYAIL